MTKSFVGERQFIYINLIVALWYSDYEIGEMSDGLLRATAASVFAGEPGRTYWAASGSFWRNNYPGRRARRFHRILDETYREALKTPPARPPEAATPERSARIWPALLAATMCGAAAVVGLRRLWRERR